MTTEDKNVQPIALVTGGATGIGAACVRELSGAGFAVHIHYNQSHDAAAALQRELPGSTVISADISTQEGGDALYAHMKKNGGIDVLVNNAGISVDAPLFTASLGDFDRMVATNIRSSWYLTKRLARLIMRKKSGRIINISSVVGSTGNIGQTIYGLTKAAIDNFTRSAALELAPYNILVNAVAPGFIATRMTDALSDEIKEGILAKIPLGRMGRPEEVAQMVRFLAVEGGYSTGTVFHINGGMYGG